MIFWNRFQTAQHWVSNFWAEKEVNKTVKTTELAPPVRCCCQQVITRYKRSQVYWEVPIHKTHLTQRVLTWPLHRSSTGMQHWPLRKLRWLSRICTTSSNQALQISGQEACSWNLTTLPSVLRDVSTKRASSPSTLGSTPRQLTWNESQFDWHLCGIHPAELLFVECFTNTCKPAINPPDYVIWSDSGITVCRVMCCVT